MRENRPDRASLFDFLMQYIVLEKNMDEKFFIVYIDDHNIIKFIIMEHVLWNH